MTSVWGIEGFRFHQEGVINATMSGRDVVCIMPTGSFASLDRKLVLNSSRAGGGKSLTFQASALLSKGVTIVITPLISLMQDQCYNLQAVNVRAEAINGETPAAVATAMLKSIIAGTSAGGAKSKATTKGKGKGKEREDSVEFEEVTDTREIKLIYVSPSIWAFTMSLIIFASVYAREARQIQNSRFGIAENLRCWITRSSVVRSCGVL